MIAALDTSHVKRELVLTASKMLPQVFRSATVRVAVIAVGVGDCISVVLGVLGYWVMKGFGEASSAFYESYVQCR